jgi:hypothetical protein
MNIIGLNLFPQIDICFRNEMNTPMTKDKTPVTVDEIQELMNCNTEGPESSENYS